MPPRPAAGVARVGSRHIVGPVFPPVLDQIAFRRERLAALAALERLLLGVSLQVAPEVLPVVDLVAHGTFLREAPLAVLLVRVVHLLLSGGECDVALRTPAKRASQTAQRSHCALHAIITLVSRGLVVPKTIPLQHMCARI